MFLKMDQQLVIKNGTLWEIVEKLLKLENRLLAKIAKKLKCLEK